jgi:hypothetical protein
MIWSFKIFLKFEFLKKTYLFKLLKKNHQNCSLPWPHIWKVSFWDLNAENLVHLTWNDAYEIESIFMNHTVDYTKTYSHL